MLTTKSVSTKRNYSTKCALVLITFPLPSFYVLLENNKRSIVKCGTGFIHFTTHGGNFETFLTNTEVTGSRLVDNSNA